MYIYSYIMPAWLIFALLAYNTGTQNWGASYIQTLYGGLRTDPQIEKAHAKSVHVCVCTCGEEPPHLQKWWDICSSPSYANGYVCMC